MMLWPGYIFTFLITTTTLIVTGLVLYLRGLHNEAGRKVKHVRASGPLTKHLAGRFTDLPVVDGDGGRGAAAAATAGEQGKYFAIHERASKSIGAQSVDLATGGVDEVLVRYLRHTMTLFATRLPQAYLMWMLTPPGLKPSFDKSHIRKLTFRPGDVVCGMYRVLGREPGRVEFDLVGGQEHGVEGGRLVISVDEETVKIAGVDANARTLVFGSETVVWRRVGGGKMPLERGFVWWLHELASWWLLVKGTEWVVEEGRRDEKK